LEYFLAGTEPTEIATPDAADQAEGGEEGADDAGGATMAQPDAALVLPKSDFDAGTLPALPAAENPVPLF
jgi:hypothetical protein